MSSLTFEFWNSLCKNMLLFAKREDALKVLSVKDFF